MKVCSIENQIQIISVNNDNDKLKTKTKTSGRATAKGVGQRISQRSPIMHNIFSMFLR